MLKKYLALILIIFFSGPLFSHSGKPAYHVVIDTDGALDDMRALTMFLSGNDIRVLAITCSQGSLLPESVYGKVGSLLSDLHHEGIPLGMGDGTGQSLPQWSSFVQGASWANSMEILRPLAVEKANQLLDETVMNYREKVTLIALGSLKTYADWIKSNPHVLAKIERIIWYNNPKIEKGFNYSVSPESFDFIKATGIDLTVVGDGTDHYSINSAYLDTLHALKSVYAEQIVNVHIAPEVMERMQKNMLKLWDDLVPLYLTLPVLFKSEVIDSIRIVHPDYALPQEMLYELIASLLESSTNSLNRVFTAWPVDESLYKSAYAKILKENIEQYGMVEWKAVCMTNEIHGHTGIYSIIGAKMGIRAMDYFNVGVNNLLVTTYAGNTPPLSCFNDGIQISSGATIGQGLIRISDTLMHIPTAIFSFNKQKVRISLRSDVAEKIRNDIDYGIQTYGLISENYWLYIEERAIAYWSEFSRNDIFLLEKLE